MTHQPETARELLHRHGLPEDIIDGALCLHAQELAAQQRKAHDELRPYSHMGLPCKPEYECGARRVIDLIDPTRTPAAVSAAVAPPTTHGLSVQHADALYDAIATPGPARESFDDQHARVCAVVRQILDDLLPEPAEETTTQTTAEAALAAVEAALCDTLLPDAREEALDRLMTVLPPTTDRAVLREAADRIDNEELPHDYVDMFDNGARWAAKLLRRMADETATETPTVTVHAAPDLSPTAEEALGALIDVAKQQAVCDFEHPHPEHPCGRRTAAGARQDGAET